METAEKLLQGTGEHEEEELGKNAEECAEEVEEAAEEK